MTRVFRNIRYGVLNEKKSIKYLKYAIGEIVLVVLGILIALNIDNYNEEVKKQETLRLYLRNFVSDLKQDQETMKDAVMIQSFRFHAMQYLLIQIGEDIYDPTADELFMPEYVPNHIWQESIPENYNKELIGLTFLWTHRTVSQNLSTSTIDELKSTGVFSHIDNHELKSAINGYYDYWSHRLGERNQSKMLQQIAEWERSLGEEGLFTSMFYELNDPLAIIRSNTERIFLLKNLIREAAWVVQVADGVIQYSQGLIEYIENNHLQDSN